MRICSMCYNFNFISAVSLFIVLNFFAFLLDAHVAAFRENLENVALLSLFARDSMNRENADDDSDAVQCYRTHA